MLDFLKTHVDSPCLSTGYLECHGEMCAMNVCFDVYEAGIGREIWVHKVNR